MVSVSDRSVLVAQPDRLFQGRQKISLGEYDVAIANRNDSRSNVN